MRTAFGNQIRLLRFIVFNLATLYRHSLSLAVEFAGFVPNSAGLKYRRLTMMLHADSGIAIVKKPIVQVAYTSVWKMLVEGGRDVRAFAKIRTYGAFAEPVLFSKVTVDKSIASVCPINAKTTRTKAITEHSFVRGAEEVTFGR